ncbi:hypothetical protein [Streptococcus plurextorum]|uniref:hypothetical protein n=1 Tax=Streptococcus plurextorum TaxID=456876 RepID=UPI0004074720|nr:hypothetical protein [Streptococcus plurextorum]
MKRYYLLTTCLLSLALVACRSYSLETDVQTTTNKTSSELANPSQKERLETLAAVPIKPITDSVAPVNKARLAPADNGIVQTDLQGNPIIHYRDYIYPSTWELYQSRIPDADIDYIAYGQHIQPIVQLYTLDAYEQSPLDGGEIHDIENLNEVMTRDGQYFQAITNIQIDDQEWYVGYEEKENNNTAKLTFYRLENTGNFDDSILVGAIIFPISAEGRDLESDLHTTIGYLKTVLYQLSKKA